MTSRRIDPVLVEKAREAYRRTLHQISYFGMMDYDGPSPVEAVVEAVFDELGLKEEHKTRRAFVGPDDVEYPDERRVRYVSPWRPVEQGDTE